MDRIVVPPDDHEARRLALLVLLTALLLAPRLTGPLLEPEEARYAEIPRQMLARGDFLVPTYDGRPYLDKPPLLYWLVMAAYRVLGVSTFAARVVPVAAAALTVAVVYLWGRRAAGADAAFASAAVLLLTPDFLYRGPMLTMNGLLALMVTAAWAAAHTAMLAGGRLGWWAVAGLACGLGVLSKGLVAVALVAGPWPFWLVLDRRLRRPGLLDGLGFLTGCALVAVPWPAAVAAREPGFVEYFFWTHHVRRYLDPFDHARPWWDYLPQLLAGTLPWGLLLAPALRHPGRRGGAVWVGLAAAAVTALFFSLSGSKRPVYLVPVYPPLALALGTFLAGAPAGWRARPALVRAAGGGTFAVLLAGTLLLGAVYAPRFSTEREVRAAAAGAGNLPAFSYPRAWDSTRFALERGDVCAFGPDERPALHDAVRRGGPALLVARSGPDLAALLADLPADLAFTPCRAGPFATAGLLLPRNTPDRADGGTRVPRAEDLFRESGGRPPAGGRGLPSPGRRRPRA